MIWLAEACILRVVDGDTVHSNLDIGWGIVLRPRIGKNPGPGTIRLVYEDGSKWDAPEQKKEPIRWALAKTAIEQRLEIGGKYCVVSHRIDDFGRTLGSIRLDNGADLAATLHSLGHAKGG